MRTHGLELTCNTSMCTLGLALSKILLEDYNCEINKSFCTDDYTELKVHYKFSDYLPTTLDVRPQYQVTMDIRIRNDGKVRIEFFPFQNGPPAAIFLDLTNPEHDLHVIKHKAIAIVQTAKGDPKSRARRTDVIPR